MRKSKISIYVDSRQKEELVRLAGRANLSLSEYLLMRGLERPVESGQQKAKLTAIACQIYTWSDTLEAVAQRDEARAFGRQIYGILEG